MASRIVGEKFHHEERDMTAKRESESKDTGTIMLSHSDSDECGCVRADDGECGCVRDALKEPRIEVSH